MKRVIVPKLPTQEINRNFDNKEKNFYERSIAKTLLFRAKGKRII